MPLEVIFDTSAFIPQEKDEEERKAIEIYTSIFFKLNIKLCLTESILKEYSSKLRYFSTRGGFREKFRKIIRFRRIKKYRCQEKRVDDLIVHKFGEPNVDLTSLRSLCQRRGVKYDAEDEKFLILFLDRNLKSPTYLVTSADDLEVMVREAIREYRLDKNLVLSPSRFLRKYFEF